MVLNLTKKAALMRGSRKLEPIMEIVQCIWRKSKLLRLINHLPALAQQGSFSHLEKPAIH